MVKNPSRAQILIINIFPPSTSGVRSFSVYHMYRQGWEAASVKQDFYRSTAHDNDIPSQMERLNGGEPRAIQHRGTP